MYFSKSSLLFCKLLFLCPEVLLVSGDFNFHLDDPSDADARTFMELMDTFGLLQHITTPTHVSGHIFDLNYHLTVV